MEADYVTLGRVALTIARSRTPVDLYLIPLRAGAPNGRYRILFKKPAHRDAFNKPCEYIGRYSGLVSIQQLVEDVMEAKGRG